MMAEAPSERIDVAKLKEFFKHGDKLYRSKEVAPGAETCHKCAFYTMDCLPLKNSGAIPRCTEHGRDDGREVVFKEVKLWRA